MIADANQPGPCVFSQVVAGESVTRATSVDSSFSSSTPPPAPAMPTLEELEIQEVLHRTDRLHSGMARDVAILWNIALSDIDNDTDQPDACMVVRLPSVEAAAESLMHHLKHLVTGAPIPEGLCPDTMIENVTEAAMSHSYFRVIMYVISRILDMCLTVCCSNGASGDGPRRQVWSHIVSGLLGDWKHFMRMVEDDFYTPSLVPAPAVSKRDRKVFIFFGFII